MIGRKITMIRNGQIISSPYFHPLVPDIQKIKYSINENAKKIGYLSLVLIIRLYVRSSKFLKQRYEEAKIKVKNKFTKKAEGLNGEPTEEYQVSGFLKMISEYKHKIRNIKHKIHEEENNQ